MRLARDVELSEERERLRGPIGADLAGEGE